MDDEFFERIVKTRKPQCGGNHLTDVNRLNVPQDERRKLVRSPVTCEVLLDLSGDQIEFFAGIAGEYYPLPAASG